MTGMRLGELRALRWSDIDYRAMKIRVRREYVRGQNDTPKSLGHSAASRSPRGSSPSSTSTTSEPSGNQDNDLVLAHHTPAGR